MIILCALSSVLHEFTVYLVALLLPLLSIEKYIRVSYLVQKNSESDCKLYSRQDKYCFLFLNFQIAIVAFLLLQNYLLYTRAGKN